MAERPDEFGGQKSERFDMDKRGSRPTWSRQIEFTLAGVGSAVGLGNIWRFPYLCFRSGGGAFLVPYLLMLVVLGIPLLHMELTVGQYTKRGPVHALAQFCPLLKGVGIASAAISFIMCTYYNVVITWALYYLFSSFQDPLPWESCNNTWNTPNCTDHATNGSYSSTASQEFFRYKMLQQTGGIEEAGAIRWELFLILVLAWILIYLCIFKGTQSTGKVVYVTALLPYVILVALLINNVQLPGAKRGINFFIVPEWDKLLSVEFAMVEVMVTSLTDQSNQHLLKLFKRKELLVLVVCGIACLLGIPNVTQAGIYVFQLMDHYTAIVSIVFLAFFEVVGVCWLYGASRLSDNLEEMTGKRPNIFFRLCWQIVAPFLITVILISSIIQFKPARYEGYVFPPWAQGLGWLIAMASVIWIPLGTVHTLWVLPGSFVQKLKLSITPYALNETSKMPYYERGGSARQPAVAVISTAVRLQDKLPNQAN
ncbi:sodium-dependent dopamine transporter isoform X3 [Phyllopteryx taeniolatus]|uniref:sodium-dependent dopamine transporter isoform X3 n=1 Tax=Phyllopteryx taeniolatus TaxID=161469 RepID=UPI002AD4195D|nr:sodium-dependent dopamine transporter isoform X3 [Phyllopteryx taeniolatus]